MERSGIRETAEIPDSGPAGLHPGHDSLIDSLDLEPDFSVSPEWQAEIRRRCADMDSGKVTVLDGAPVVNELRGKYTG